MTDDTHIDPPASETSASESVAPDTAPPAGKSTVLVCDDSKMVRITAKKFLSDRFNLLLAEDGEEGWETICNDESVQAVFTDLGMPRLNGYGLIERVRNSDDERIRSLPIIVITGANDDEDIKRKVFEVGATDFIGKPFKATALVARAEAHASYRKLSSELKDKVDIDPVTGVFNRKGLDVRLEKDMSFVRRHGESLVISLLEIDDFEDIQKKIGQKKADVVLKEIAKILQSAIRAEDSIGRDGIAQFLLSLPMAKTDGVIKLSRRICEKVATLKIKIGEEVIPLSCSVGISSAYRDNHPEPTIVVDTAKKALENARALGRGEVQFLGIDYEDTAEDEEEFSIDSMLVQIDQGQPDTVMSKLDAILQRLLPLVGLMSDEQKQRLISTPPDGRATQK